MKLNIFFVSVVIILLAYFAGIRVASQKCKTQITELKLVGQLDINKTMDEINEKTFNTSVRDIRRILHEKYTIAD